MSRRSKFNDYEDRFIDSLDRKFNNPREYSDRIKQEEEEFYKELDKYYHLQDINDKKKSKTKVYEI